MPTEVIMPQMGESIFEGTITKWLKTIGDAVEKDEPLFEISTDKVDAEIPSPVAGVLAEIRFPEGATVEVNTVVAVIGEAGAAVAAPERLQRKVRRARLARQRTVASPKVCPTAGGAGRPHPLLAAGPPHRQRARPRPQPHRRHRLRRPHHKRGCSEPCRCTQRWYRCSQHKSGRSRPQQRAGCPTAGGAGAAARPRQPAHRTRPPHPHARHHCRAHG